MKKNQRKLKKWGFLSLAVVVLVAVASVFFLSTEAEAETSVPSSIVGNSEKGIGDLISNYHFGKLTSNVMSYVYCSDYHKSTPHGVSMSRVGEASAGVSYIFANGYPNRSFTGNSDYDYYITQSAVWWYLDDTTGSNNLTESFRSSGADNYGLRSHIIALVNEAKNHANYAQPSISINNSDNTMHLTEDKNYYESNSISISGTSLEGNYTVSLSNAPSGMEVVNASNNVAQTVFAQNESFKVRIPVSSVTSMELKADISVQATGVTYKAYLYSPGSGSSAQSVYVGPFKETIPVSASTNVTLSTSQVSILKVDSDTGEPLAGAHLVLMDGQGKKVAEWTTTENAYVIKNLPKGTYVLKELAAPEGYELATETATIEITDTNRDIKVKFGNAKIAKRVTIIKVDKDTGNPVSGAKLVIKDADGEVVEEFTSSVDPYVLNDIADGTYTVEEVEAPAGYKKSDEVYTFTISDESNNVAVYFENESIDKKVTILKIDKSTGNPLAGAHLVVKNAAGEVVADFVTTTENFVINGISDGEYTVEEVEAPEGYQLASDVYTFTISDETPNVTVTIENIPEVEVPFTGSSQSIFPTLFGISILLGGIGFVLYHDKKQRLQ